MKIAPAPARALAVAASGLLSLALLTAAAPAHGYCRLTTEQNRASRCPEPCSDEGAPLAWSTVAEYTFHEDFLPTMTEGDVRKVFDTSFDEWLRTDCMEGPVDVDVEQDPDTTSIDVASEFDGVSVVIYRDPERWSELHPGSSRAFALTLVAFTETAGRIVGADMELNGGIGEFTECPDGGCDERKVDLGNVVTHEAGHFLGLAHSDVPGSTMSCDADPGDVDKRTLAQDDIDGICEAYPGREVEGGCSCQSAAGSSRDLGSGLLALGLAAWLARRRRLGV